MRPTRYPRNRTTRRAALLAPGCLALAVAVLAAAGCTPARGTNQRVSTLSNGAEVPRRSFSAHVSRDGRFVTFATDSVETIPGIGGNQVFRKDRTTGEVVQVSLDVTGNPFRGRNVPRDISADGTRIVFVNTVPDSNGLNESNRIYVRDLVTRQTILVTATPSGGFATGDDARLSADGRVVAFTSSSSGLVPGDTNSRRDVFTRVLATGELRRVSTSFGGNQLPEGGDLPAISSDGRFVAFRTTQNLTGADTDDNEDVYVRDTVTGSTTFDSLAGPRTFARNVDISGDGRFLVFAGESGPGRTAQLWVRDRTTRALTLLSHARGSATAESNNVVIDLDISTDGRSVAFSSAASDMATGTDVRGELDVFLTSSTGGPISRLSLRPDGSEPLRTSQGGQVADGGKVIAFQSEDAGIVSGDTNATTDVFVHALR
jgi:Tol biopolymer transport system component